MAGWGRLLLDRWLRGQGIDPLGLTTLQRLAIAGTDARGALEYEPGELAALVKLGGSSGGARPKVFCRDGDGEWLVKFAASIDPPDVGRVEYGYSLLARRCGVDMADTRLFDGRFFGTRRFDRTDAGKVHVVSAAGLLDADYRIPSLDYRGLLALTRRLTRDMVQVEQMFRRMVFNVAIGNRDDHAKNFAYLMDDSGTSSLAPAYDLLPSPGFNGFHTTTVNGSGNPSDEDLLTVGVRAGLSKGAARGVLWDIRDTVNQALTDSADDVQAAWTAEIRSRVDDIVSGRVKTLSGAEVRQRISASLAAASR
jgi:serine/threonine-protein kinase HipA